MGRSGSTLILLVVALGFGGYLYFVDSKRPVEDENAKKKVFTYEAEKINQLQIKSSSGEVTALRKDASGTGRSSSPTQAPADRNSVSDIVTSLANARGRARRRGERGRPEGVRPGRAAHRRDVPRRRRQGAEADPVRRQEPRPASGIYAKLPSEQPRVPRLELARAPLNKSTFDFRDKTALKFEQDKVTSIELASSTQTIRLEKTGDDWKLVKPVQAPADFVSVNGLLGQLQSAQMMALKDRPEDLKDLKQYGLDRPEVVATHRHGRVGREARARRDGRSRLGLGARPVESRGVQRQQRRCRGAARRRPDDLRRKEIFDFRPFNTTRFEITRGKDMRAFERVKGTGENAVDTWKQVAPAAKTVDSSNLEGALLEFSNLRAESFVDRAGPATGLSNPGAVIAVKFEDGKKEERVTSSARGAERLRDAARPARRAEARGWQVRRRHQEARRHSVR